MSGAGKSTVLDALEDMGWDTVDNLPTALIGDFVHGADRDRRDAPAAIGMDSRSRGFDPQRLPEIFRSVAEVRPEILYLDASGAELVRRYDETRRRHPLAPDRPAEDGIARERELTEPLRRWASQVIDTTSFSSNALQQAIRDRFSRERLSDPVLTILSFGFSRGMPRNADLMFDMRFLRNPHWDDALRDKTGQDADVAAYIMADPAYEEAVGKIEELLKIVLPRYAEAGKAYITVAFGCTGGRHRSVHVAERVARYLQDAGFSPTVSHRNMESAPQDSLEKRRPGGPKATS